MRKQRLPKEFWTGLNLSDRNVYCFWYDKTTLKKCHVKTEREAREFVKRAEDKNVAAFATAYVEPDQENEIFECSYKGALEKYEFKDYVRLEIARANQILWRWPEEKAKKAAQNRTLEQWGNAEYDIRYSDAEYHVSWYNPFRKMFEEAKFVSLVKAEEKFNEMKTADMPVRLSEYREIMHQVHEIKSARQHWHIGMGAYLQQMADKTLPIGETAYAFSNSYLVSKMQVSDGCGYLEFNVGWTSYELQLTRFLNGMSVYVHKGTSLISYINIDDNPIVEPWLARIEKQ